MNKKRFSSSVLVIVGLFFTINSHSQDVIVNLYQPPYNQWNLVDIWNLTLTNLTSESLGIYLYGTVEEQSDGIIFEGESAVFSLPANFSGRIDPQQLEPANIIYTHPGYEEFVMRTGTMREGVYKICIKVKDAKTEAVLGEDCVDVIIQPTSPPQLLNPEDEAELVEPLPVFMWLPPMPLTGNYSVSYMLKIVELYDGQVPMEAMEANPNWFTEKNMPSTSFQLPIAARPFQPGKQYAWQVTAFGSKYEVGKSEVWTFNYNVDYRIIVDSMVILDYRWDLDDGTDDKSREAGIKFEWDLDIDDEVVMMLKEGSWIWIVLCDSLDGPCRDTILRYKMNVINKNEWDLDDGTTAKLIQEEEDTIKRKPWAWDMDDDDEIRIIRVSDDDLKQSPDQWDIKQAGIYYKIIKEEKDSIKRQPWAWDLDDDGEFKMIRVSNDDPKRNLDKWDINQAGVYYKKMVPGPDSLSYALVVRDLNNNGKVDILMKRYDGEKRCPFCGYVIIDRPHTCHFDSLSIHSYEWDYDYANRKKPDGVLTTEEVCDDGNYDFAFSILPMPILATPTFT